MDIEQNTLFVFEGIDGVGKTTMAKRLAADLDASYGYEPGCSSQGPVLRELLLHSDLDPMAKCLLFAADRFDNVVHNVLPALNDEGRYVLDRFVGSAIAYGHYGSGLDRDWLYEINRPAMELLARYCNVVTILLSWPADELEDRLPTSGDSFESKGHQFYLEVDDGYRALARASYWWNVEVVPDDLDATYSKVLDVAQNQPWPSTEWRPMSRCVTRVTSS